MENERIVRLQQLVENLADSVATMQIHMQQQQQQQQQRQYPNPQFAEEGEEDDVESDEEENPFAERQPERQRYNLRGKQSGVLVFYLGLDLVVGVWPNKRLSEVEAQLGGVAVKPPTLNPVKPVASIAGALF
ncbi:hypothetical protein Acr_00g0042370 [Actinidia rufa]|uniref:Uncharacterized protein n=1 Tax=Actinidia rufa TaxID=165716 RepID=A0A7J0DII1_9ERIC|nr:hypothetical protein Acr_00g0042370 [Actinidia rufa]